MDQQKLITGKCNLQMFAKFIIISVGSLFFLSCQKDMGSLQEAPAVISNSIRNFHISKSNLVLLPGNAANTAVTLSWQPDAQAAGQQITYTIEAAINGTDFAEPIELSSGNQTSINFTVKEFNSQILKLVNAGNTGVIAIRIRAENFIYKMPAVYSDGVALNVTPYQCYKEYEESHVIKIPGNYQDWKLLGAPEVVETGNTGEYEGYINFTNPYSQFIIVKGKGSEWNTQTIFTYIGANKFGFGGTMMSIIGGAGVYRMKVNTNTNTWAYTKINSWGLHGNAVIDGNQDKVMAFDASVLTWSITTNLVAGDFLLRANNSNEISFGHNSNEETGVPAYDGEKIHITKAGKYTIKLQLQSAGNYYYGVQKNP